jgi:Domain of unknown function (DUF5667)
MTAPHEPGWAVEERLAELWQVDPDPDVVTRARTATLAAFTGRSARRRRLRVPVAVAACVLVSGATGAWTAAAASSALPGDTAYGLKRAVEQVQLAVAVGDEAEADVLLRLADRRVGEAVRAEAVGRLDAVEEAVEGYGDVMAELAPREEALPDAALRARADQAREVHRQVLGALVDSLPPPARAAIQQRLAESIGVEAETGPALPEGVPVPPGRPGGLPFSPDPDDLDPADRSAVDDRGRPGPGASDGAGPGVPPGSAPDLSTVVPDPPAPALDPPDPAGRVPAPAQRGIDGPRPPAPSTAESGGGPP